MISCHSLLELNLALSLYRLAGVGQQVGRVALGNPRGSDVLERMLQLAEIRGLDLSPFPWSKFKSTLDTLKTKRDLFAHSPWAYNANTKQYIVFATSGHWPRIAGAPKRSRRIYPEGMAVTARDLRELRSDIESAIKESEELDRFVQISVQMLEAAGGAPG